PRGQLHLPAVLAYAGTADNNTTTAHGQACVSASPTYWVPCGALGLDRAAQPLSVLLKHLVEGFQPLLYHELVQLVANDGCQSQRSLFRHVSLFAALLSSGILLHGGSFRWCLGPEIISGSNEDRHLCVQLRSTASGTSPGSESKLVESGLEDGGVRLAQPSVGTGNDKAKMVQETVAFEFSREDS